MAIVGKIDFVKGEQVVHGKDHRLAKGVVPGVILILLLLPVGAYLYMRFGSVPVAVADTPFPDEEKIVAQTTAKEKTPMKEKTKTKP
jgi:hypothetical protein